MREIIQDCTICQAVARIPEEIHTFKPNNMPDHPGQAFTVDVLRFDRKKVLVATDNFSGFVATLFIKTEKQEDLEDGIIQAVTPFKAASLATVRVDQAPAFKAIMVRPANLKEVGIELEPGECKNKNALALVDRKMQELESEIKKAAPGKKTLDVKVLARATTAVNEKVRHQGFSAKEIIFSRDQSTLENLDINDEALAAEKMKIRQKENIYSAKARAEVQTAAKSANARKGQLVFLKKDGSKLERRDLYLVTGTMDEEDMVMLCKLPSILSGNTPVQFQPHNIIYKVRQTEIYLSPNQPAVAEFIEEENVTRLGEEYETNLGGEYEPEQEQNWGSPHSDQKTFRTQKQQLYEDDDDEYEDYFGIDSDQASRAADPRADPAAQTGDDDQVDVAADHIADRDELLDVIEVPNLEEQNNDVHNGVEDPGEDPTIERQAEQVNHEIEDDMEQEVPVPNGHQAAEQDIGEGDTNDVSQEQIEDRLGGARNRENQEVTDNDTERESEGDENDDQSRESDADADLDTTTENSDDEAENDDLQDKNSNPANLPNVGARIAFKNPDSNEIIRATVVPMHRTMQYQWPGWRNIKIDGERQLSSVNMDVVSHGCVVWRYLQSTPIPRHPGQGYIPQTDGNYTLPSGSSHHSSYQYYSDIESVISDDISVEAVHQALFGLTRTFFNPPVQARPQPQESGRLNRVLNIFSRVCRQVSQPFRRR